MSQEYQKKSQREHVLLRPDVYVGSMEAREEELPVLDISTHAIQIRKVKYIPGILKVFDEILVNAADNYQRDPKMKNIKVKINAKGHVTITNDGRGIPIVKHEKYGIYIPELVMGHLLAGSNFDDTKERLAGGRHGYGAKLTNIFSTSFTVETGDSQHELEYKQSWHDNMERCDDAIVTPSPGCSDYTRVTFQLDLKRFGLGKTVDDDVLALWARRVADVAACNPQLSCKLNGKTVKVTLKHMAAAVAAFGLSQRRARISDKDRLERLSQSVAIHDKAGRWHCIVGARPSKSTRSDWTLSFVNNACTHRGGTHVRYIADQVVDYVMELLRKKHKQLDVKEKDVRSCLWVVVSAFIVNPAFDSQAKELLVTPESQFGSELVLSKVQLKRIVDKTGLLDEVVAMQEVQMDKDLDRASKKISTAGTGASRRPLIPKLEDANWAGTKRAGECTLILTEGDSAKSLAVSGLSVLGRDRYGVFPLKGKLKNVREASHQSVLQNAEFTAIKAILGLEHGSARSSVATQKKGRKEAKGDELRRKLRYGKVMLMTDQDHDGSHIKGLFFNMLHSYWPALIKDNHFVCEFVTPLIKAFPKSAAGPKTRPLTFFSVQEFQEWAASVSGAERRKWRLKYYKGLGTNSAQEGKEYFSNLARHSLDMVWEGDADDKALELVFSKKQADQRKQWLLTATAHPPDYIDHAQSELTYNDFVHKELVQFSLASVQRSIPSVLDGLKPSSRKILFACFKRRLASELKVAQLGGYVAEQTGYHHGEASLYDTIVRMAHDYPGSNNLPLLHGIGQFGTRLEGGKDAASPRYIFTLLHNHTRLLFPEADDSLLAREEEDGLLVEPTAYLPIIPMLLVNGSVGIGTGWSTDIPQYNPLDVIDTVAALLKEQAPTELTPWFAGYRGRIEMDGKRNQFTSEGKLQVVGEHKVQVTELALRDWTEDFLNRLKALIAGEDGGGGQVVDYDHKYSVVAVDCTVELAPEFPSLSSGEGKEEALEKVKAMLGLQRNHSLRNMYAFDPSGKIKLYGTPTEMVQDYLEIRLKLYHRRKRRDVCRMRSNALRLANQVRFLDMVSDGSLSLKKGESALDGLGFTSETELREVEHAWLAGDAEQAAVHASRTGAEASMVGREHESDVDAESKSGETSLATRREEGITYGYLLRQPMFSLTAARREKLEAQRRAAQEELERMERLDPKDIWLEELGALRTVVAEYLRGREAAVDKAWDAVEEEPKPARKKSTKRTAKR